jgi:hypothetical protein
MIIEAISELENLLMAMPPPSLKEVATRKGRQNQKKTKQQAQNLDIEEIDMTYEKEGKE